MEKILKIKPLIFLISISCLASSTLLATPTDSNATSQQPQTYQHGNQVIQPQYTLTSCTLPPPNGYIWTNSAINYNCSTSGELGYVFQSYFDKAIGAQLNMCAGQTPPSGWFIVKTFYNSSCTVTAQNNYVIQRYQ